MQRNANTQSKLGMHVLRLYNSTTIMFSKQPDSNSIAAVIQSQSDLLNPLPTFEEVSNYQLYQFCAYSNHLSILSSAC